MTHRTILSNLHEIRLVVAQTKLGVTDGCEVARRGAEPVCDVPQARVRDRRGDPPPRFRVPVLRQARVRRLQDAAAVSSMGTYDDPTNDNPRHGPEDLGGSGSALRHQIRTVEAGVSPPAYLAQR